MVPQQELICSLELECSRKFGNNKYSFYHPIQLENFFIMCWKTQTASEHIGGPSSSYTKSSSSSNHHHHQEVSVSGDRYCCSIYEDGEIIHPIQDARMRNFTWAKSFSKKKDFSKEELETLLSDIYTQCCLSKKL